jgi:hypothetical protein
MIVLIFLRVVAAMLVSRAGHVACSGGAVSGHHACYLIVITAVLLCAVLEECLPNVVFRIDGVVADTSHNTNNTIHYIL